VRRDHDGAVLGVFAVYTGIDTMVADSERTQLIIGATAVLIMALLYVSLLAVVQRIARIGDVRQEALRERS